MQSHRHIRAQHFSCHPESERIIMFSAVLLTAIGAIAAFGAVSAVVVSARDGYREIPTRRA